MQQTMGDLKFLNKIVVLTVSVFLFIGCHPREPREPRLELQLKKQNVGEVFLLQTTAKRNMTVFI